MNQPQRPKLKPPGAGLPFRELTVLRIVFRLKRFFFDQEKLSEAFQKERQKILRLVESCPQPSEQVLIDRLRGLEDSSRFWSVYMAVEHLAIVNKSISSIVTSLKAGRVPKNVVRIADVKPSDAADTAALETFGSACDHYLECVNGTSDLKTRQKFPHPWIGPMNALDWHALGALHMGIHRQQIEKIIEAQRK